MKLGSMVCAVFWLAGVSPTVAQAPAQLLSPLQQSLMDNEQSLIEAKKKDDAVFFKRTVSPDFAMVGIDGQLLQGREAIDNLGDSDLAELTPYDMKVMVADDETGIVTYDSIVREKPQQDQGPPPRYQHFSSVWMKQGGAWKLKFQQATATHWGDW